MTACILKGFPIIYHICFVFFCCSCFTLLCLSKVLSTPFSSFLCFLFNGMVNTGNNPEIENMAERLKTNDILIQAGEYFDVSVLLQSSCFRKYVGLDLAQTGSLGVFVVNGFDLLFRKKFNIKFRSERTHSPNSCLFPILVCGSFQGLSVVVICKTTVWRWCLTVEPSSRKTRSLPAEW